MDIQSTSDLRNVQTAAQRVEACEHLTGPEKASLTEAVNELQAKLTEKETQVHLLQKEGETTVDIIDKLIAELEEKKKLIASQNEERQIEAALEAVRSRSLAMTQPDELYEVVTVVLEKLQELGITMQARSAFIAIFDESKQEMVEWVASPEHAQSLRFTTTRTDHPVSSSIWQAKTSGTDFLSRSFTVEEKNSYFDYYFHHVCCTSQLDHVKKMVFESNYYSYFIAFEKNSAIGISSFANDTLSERETEILKRFARVFEQAYIRFLDLQKAEAQAKEARTEAALERIRSRTMAMQNSRDVSDAIGLLFTELDKLGIVTLRCGILIIEEESYTLQVWSAAFTPEGRVGKAGGRFSFSIHPMLEEAFQCWKQKETLFTYELAGDELVNYLKIIQVSNPQYKLPPQSFPLDRQFACTFFFNEGALFTFTTEPHTQEAISVLKKFAAVFGLTYRRYLDLKTAEEQARQALKQASIDRLRAEIASMRSTEDLRRVTPLLWQELHALQVSFVRCGVFIVNEAAGVIQAYLSTPEGKSRGMLKMGINENEHTRLLFQHWKQQTVYTDQWTRKQLVSWLAHLSKANLERVSETPQPESTLPDLLHLHFAPFTQGMLYVGHTTPLTEEELQVVKSLAEAFAIAYARYDDFRQLEEAMSKLETTIRELKTTQRQLIQAEKMASLGELTAGIAHEIQNPLNFITNFSDLNTDLLDELKQELEKGNVGETKSLVQVIKENEEKIKHHGLRADSIVKAMLQHSRKSKGKKEPTDINALTDEYLRLSYHGVRAKVKDFKVNLVTNFDEGLGKIDVSPQDLGRALLNLFNNAFYAVNVKKKMLDGDFAPSVVVCTKRVGSNVQILVRDNGTGIPATILTKIFQPFFTTKPTGEGTGLGLSLSYDIITKGHGGELKVATEEGKYAEFIIELPVS
jgi:signal transduction histidine kinase